MPVKHLLLQASSSILLLLMAFGQRAEEHPSLGIAVQTSDSGVVVVRVDPGSPGEAGGLRSGDRIVGVGPRYVGSDVEFRRAIEMHQGDTFGLKVNRSAGVIEVLVPRDPGDPRFRDIERARRQCASYCLVQATRQWRECGCVVAECRTCNGCTLQR